MKLSDKEKQIKILFEDNHLLVAVKPSPYLTQPTNQEKNSLQTYLKIKIKKEKRKLGNVYLHCIHRLDKKVSGIVVFAKSSKALKRLQEMQREKKIQKKYIAILHGNLDKKDATLTNYLIHDSFKATISVSSNKKAKLSSLSYRVIDFNMGNSVVLINLNTGRYHQIRAQFSHIKHPVIGDKKYSSLFDYEGIMLHHALISFIHPISKKQMTFISKPFFGIDAQLFDKHLKPLL